MSLSKCGREDCERGHPVPEALYKGRRGEQLEYGQEGLRANRFFVRI